MEYVLQNQHLTVRVCSKGAELTGLFSKQTGLEYLWQPGGEIWAHSSLLLFPNPGRIAHDRILVEGKAYPAMMHGFASEKEFDLLEQTDTRLLLQLQADDHTRRYFPYEFAFQVELILEGDRLVQNLHVVNRDQKPMHYCLGAHPGFYCPIGLGEPAEDYSLVFDRPQNLFRREMQQNTRLLTGAQTPYLQQQTTIPLHNRFFDNGPMLFGGMDAATVTLRSEKSGRFVEMGIGGFPELCLWGMATQMSIIAIEPWIGTTDRFDTDHVWEKKPGNQRLEAGCRRTHTLTFRVG